MQREQSLWIVNRNMDAHGDRYDGEDYWFPPNEPVEIPVFGADLMFGYGQTDKTSTLMRAGVAQTANDLKQGLVWLANFQFFNTKPTDRELAPAVESPPGGESVAAPPGDADPKPRPVPQANSTSRRVPA